MRSNRNLRLLLLAAAFILALVPASTLATDPRGGDNAAVQASEEQNDANLHLDIQNNWGVTTEVGEIGTSGTIIGDLTFAGDTISVSGLVDQTIRVAGLSVDVDWTVGEDPVLKIVRAAAPLGSGDGRDSLGGVGNVNVAAGPSLSLISSPVTGASTAPGARMTWGVTQSAPETQLQQASTDFVNLALGWVRRLVGVFALGAFLVLMWPGFSRRASGTLNRSPWASLGIGLVLFVNLPLLAVLLFVVGLFAGGWWLGLLVLGVYLLLLVLGLVVAGLTLGRWAVDRVRPGQLRPVWTLLLGLAALLLVGLLPFVGGLVVGAAVVFGMGALAIALVQARQEPAAGVVTVFRSPEDEVAA